jgi:hypothetical protein
MMGVMFTSLNVVSIAVSFFTATSLSASFNRKVDIFLRSVSLAPAQEEVAAAVAAAGVSLSFCEKKNSTSFLPTL